MSATLVDTDAVKASELLYTIAERMRAERKLWASAPIRLELEDAARQTDMAARHALTQTPLYGESFAHAAELTLRKYVGLRKFIEHCTRGTGPGYITLDCRDGQHPACGHCGCWCHS